MPPKPRITKEMVVDAALAVARAHGAESINARTVARQLGCSTQPVMYHFAMIEELRRAAYDRLDRLHTEYLLNVPPDADPLLGIGLNYVRVAVEEPNWFRFLFQSGCARRAGLRERIDSDELAPVVEAMREGMGTDLAEAKEIFLIVALFTHGMASMIANGALTFDEEQAAAQLERAYMGAAAARKEETV